MMLSHTVICSNSRTSWKVRVRLCSGFSWAFTTRNPVPSMITMPPSRGSTPVSRFTSVDFPDPFGPTMLVIPCLGIRRLSSSTAFTAPNSLEMSTVSMAVGSLDSVG